jgi:hypothetical protein
VRANGARRLQIAARCQATGRGQTEFPEYGLALVDSRVDDFPLASDRIGVKSPPESQARCAMANACAILASSWS